MMHILFFRCDLRAAETDACAKSAEVDELLGQRERLEAVCAKQRDRMRQLAGELAAAYDRSGHGVSGSVGGHGVSGGVGGNGAGLQTGGGPAMALLGNNTSGGGVEGGDANSAECERFVET